MTSEELGEMFEGDFADMCAANFQWGKFFDICWKLGISLFPFFVFPNWINMLIF